MRVVDRLLVKVNEVMFSMAAIFQKPRAVENCSKQLGHRDAAPRLVEDACSPTRVKEQPSQLLRVKAFFSVPDRWGNYFLKCLLLAAMMPQRHAAGALLSLPVQRPCFPFSPYVRDMINCRQRCPASSRAIKASCSSPRCAIPTEIA